MAVSSGCCLPKFFPAASDCRGDSGALPRPEIPSAAASSRLLSLRCRASGLSSALILRFPPNFVRQLSTKARRNCSNIGVAQIVAASWSNNSALPETPLSASAAADAAATVVIPVEADVATPVGGDGTSTQSQIPTADSKAAAIAALLSSDGSLAVHAGERLGRVITTDAITTPVVNTSAYWFKNSNELIDFKVCD
ncbi:putative cystathionine gamma-synthase 1, chloroplastic [Cocos nucifera]|nr:putative cystathionine gamma-synthase 1, chloroplastic [Cocos nucifera]